MTPSPRVPLIIDHNRQADRRLARKREPSARPADGPLPHKPPRDCLAVYQPTHEKGATMLHYAVVFLVIALIAAVLGFGGIAAGAAGIAKVLFVVFLIGAIVTFLLNGRRNA